METGVRTETVQAGEYVETFEVAGNEVSRPAEVKITLPSYQVGIYTDPRFPFKIHCYDGREGFDFAEVQAYYGGSALVPDSCKRIYIENDLCYDIRSVVRTIQAVLAMLAPVRLIVEIRPGGLGFGIRSSKAPARTGSEFPGIRSSKTPIGGTQCIEICADAAMLGVL
jgi:hypothetical protein